MRLWTTRRSWPTTHRGPGDTVVALLTEDWRAAATGLKCSLELRGEKEVVGEFLTNDKRWRRAEDSHQ
jgi:hypothetical protein